MSDYSQTMEIMEARIKEARAYWAKVHAEATHESDKELWLEANHGAPAFTLALGVLLTNEQRERAYDMIAATEEQDRRDRYSD